MAEEGAVDGEAEAVSVKVGGVEVRGNGFEAVRGAVSLRHGAASTVVDNVWVCRAAFFSLHL